MVHFVGAGSGAADLITLRGARLLKAADIVIYTGSLINKELLSDCRRDARLYDSAYMNLDEVCEVYSENRDKDIVRLHTGDPCIFGAIREQMDRLSAMGIEYDYCPGVSSFCGAAAALKAEYTLPDVAQSVIIARAEGRTPVPKGQSIRELAAHGSTMVIFLSVGMTELLQRELTEGGYSEDTPFAIVYKATWEDERIVRGQLKELHSIAVASGIKKTALIVVGKVLGDDYALSKLYDKNFKTEFRG
jgi:precorrin-4/cobalt-precorrin-4 C11-methyltransferase